MPDDIAKSVTDPAPLPDDVACPHALLTMVRRALDDLETLIGTLSARSDRGLAAAIAKVAVPNDPLFASAEHFLLRCAELMATPPAMIASRKDLLADLIRARDALNSAAFPASAETFRLTGFYCGRRRIDGDGAEADLFASEARAMVATKWTMRAIAVLALFVLAYTILLSSAALNGRNLVLDNRTIRAEFDAANDMLARVEAPLLAAVFPNAAGAEFARDWRIHPCDGLLLLGLPPGTDPSQVRVFRDPNHVTLCETRNDRLRRLAINEAQMLDWNRWVDTLFLGVRPRVTASTRVADPDPVNSVGVSERAVASRIDDLSALLLPLYGFLGAAAFVFRRLMQKVQGAELDTTEIRQTVIRLALGTILGGVIGLFFSADGAAVSGENLPVKTLGLSALALLAGYAVELVFTFFDCVIRTLFTPLKAQAPRPG